MNTHRSKRSSQRFYQQWQKGEPIRVLFIGCLFFVLTLIPTIYAGVYWSVLGAIFAISVPLCLAFGTFTAVKGRVESVVLAFVTFILCIISSMSLVEVIYMAQGDLVQDISVSEARKYPQGRIFDLCDVRFQCQYRGFYVARSYDRYFPGKEKKQSYFVCPLVPVNWTPAEPVPAWARQEVFDEPEALPTSGTFALIAPHERHDYGEAIQDALKEHGLRTYDDAPVFHWIDSLDSYQAYLSRARTAGGIMLLVLFGGWTLITAVIRYKSYTRPQ
ncbi:hypothetical protein GF348_14525 [candidate division KSB3 bacterium]|nr:hypothetical protein [candidate division KSB3 bacterium]